MTESNVRSLAIPSGWDWLISADTEELFTSSDLLTGGVRLTTKAIIVGNKAYSVDNVVPGSGAALVYIVITNKTGKDMMFGARWTTYDPDGDVVEVAEIGTPTFTSYTPKEDGTKEFTSPVGFYKTKSGKYLVSGEIFGRDAVLDPWGSNNKVQDFSFEFESSLVGTSGMEGMMGMMMMFMMMGMIMPMMSSMTPSEETPENGDNIENNTGGI